MLSLSRTENQIVSYISLHFLSSPCLCPGHLHELLAEIFFTTGIKKVDSLFLTLDSKYLLFFSPRSKRNLLPLHFSTNKVSLDILALIVPCKPNNTLCAGLRSCRVLVFGPWFIAEKEICIYII